MTPDAGDEQLADRPPSPWRDGQTWGIAMLGGGAVYVLTAGQRVWGELHQPSPRGWYIALKVLTLVAALAIATWGAQLADRPPQALD